MDMIERGRLSNLWIAVATCGLLVACGGGGDAPAPQAGAPPVAPAPPPPPPSPLAGAYGGTLVSATSHDVVLVTREDASVVFAVYGTDAANDFKAAGLLTSWDYNNSTPTQHRSDWAWDWSADAAIQVDLSLDPATPALSGTVTAASGTRSVSGGALPAVGYQRASPASLDQIRGHWELTTAQGRPMSVDIAADGRISASSGPCTAYDSAVTPSASGQNVFALVMRFSGCAEPFAGSDGVHGFAVVYTSVGGGQQLVLGGENGWDPVHLAAAGKR